MPTPQFVLDLREHVGHALLWLPGCTAVVLRDDAAGEGTPRPQVLLTLRSDLRIWAPVAGMVEPGEEPHETAVREALEETGVHVAIEALVATGVTDPITYPNGDRCVFLDHTFRCRWLDGEARVGDDESLDVRWWPVAALPDDLRPIDRERILVALADPRPPVLGRAAMAGLAARTAASMVGQAR